MSLGSIALLFLLVILVTTFPFYLRAVYENKTEIRFYDKSKNSLKGVVYFMIEFGWFNLLLGSAHILCEK